MLSVKLRQISWGVLAIETLAIFFSVLLGFAVTEWRQTRGNATLRQEALENFYAELQANQREVEARLPYHREVAAALDSLIRGPVPASLQDALGQVGFRGTRFALLRETALRTAEVTGALGLLDFETAQALVTTYILQEDLNSVNEGVLGAVFNPATFASENTRSVLTSLLAYFDIVVEYETNLLQVYADVLPLLEREVGGRTTALASPDTTDVDSLR
ncbi:MAG: hypothetical protein HKN04_07525 [Rhodothermaceae bacterium]|nr:hypothetical protein [Rhodothermaceae bacterium]